MFWKRGSRPSYPPLPDGMVLHVVGDIHGRLDLLHQTFQLIDHDRHGDGIHAEIYLGDYIDRGPQSAAVLDALIERGQNHRLVALRGNHEEMLLGFLAEGANLKTWLGLGGLATLTSYGVAAETVRAAAPEDVAADLRARMPIEHRAFLDQMPSSFQCGDYFFAHAGIRPGIALDSQSARDLLWVRESFLADRRDHGAIIVHGHTPCDQPDFRPNRINIDTGAHASGLLTCIRIDDSGVHQFGPEGEPD